MTFSKKTTHTCTWGERWVTTGPDWVLFKHKSLTRNMNKIIYFNVSKSMGAPKRYFHVQRKLYYMEGQLGKHIYKISKIYIYLGDMKRWVTNG